MGASMEEGTIGEELTIRAPGPALLKKKFFLGRFPLTAPDFSSNVESWSLSPDTIDGASKPSSSLSKAWVLDNPEVSKPPQKSSMEGGLSKAATYFVLIRQDDEFIAVPVEHWFNFKPVRAAGEASLEEAESDMKKMDAVFGNKLVPKSMVKQEQDADDEGDGKARKRRRGKSREGGEDDDEAPEDLYQGEEDDLRPERPEQAEDWEHENNADDDDENMEDDLEEKLEDDPGERKKLGLVDDEEEEDLDEAGRALRKLVDRETKDTDEEDNKNEEGEEGGNDELDEMDEDTMDLDEVFKDDEEEEGTGKGARSSRAASPAPSGKGADGGAAGSKRKTPPPPGPKRGVTAPPGGPNAAKRKAEAGGDEQAKRARVEPKSVPPRAPQPSKTPEVKLEGGGTAAVVKTEPGVGVSKPPGSRGTPPGGSTAQRRPAAAPAAGAGQGLPTQEEIKKVVGSNRYTVKALIAHFKGRFRKEDTGVFQKTVLSVAKLSKGADGQSYLELK